MIGTEVAMTSGARARPGSEQAPVLAPLSVLVGSALLLLAQLYLAIPLAPVIGEALGSGGSAAAAAVGTSYALAYGVGFLISGRCPTVTAARGSWCPAWPCSLSSRQGWLPLHHYPR